MNIFQRMLLSMILWLAATALHASKICLFDQDGDNKYLAANESATCVIDSTSTLCPIDAVNCEEIPEVCPLDVALPCNQGMCARTQACVQDLNFPPGQLWVCPVDGLSNSDQSVCNESCGRETAMCSQPTFTCPLGKSLACINNNGIPQCSNTSCTDLTLSPPITTPVDTTMLVNDGARNPDGTCAAEITIFGGKTSSCKTDGVVSAFRNCCQENDEVLEDSYTGISNLGLAIDTISLVHTASTAAWAAYDAYVAAGVADASGAASAYFTEIMVANGAVLAAGAVVALAAYYYANACGKNDMETALFAASNMCHFIDYHCTEKWGGKCVQEEKVYCCFNSKIGRIVHEQGRQQLTAFVNNPTGIWGNGDSPYCRGFKPEEFQALDFSKIDLSEYYADIEKAAQLIQINDTLRTTIEGHVNALP